MVTAMSKQLITTQPINVIAKGETLRISTLEIAQHILAGSKQKTAGAVNKNIIRLVKRKLDGFQELGQIGFQSLFQGQGKLTEYALLNEPQTNLLFMSMNNSNPLVWKFKVALAKRFDEMKRFIQQRHNAEWLTERATGKIYTKQIGELFTQALDACGKSHNPTRYINLQQTIYKAVLGKTVQQLRKERNISKGAIIRNFLTVSELEDISAVQKIVERGFNGRSIDDDEQLTTAIINAASAIRIPFNLLIAA
jgi:phage regulator Rha-like protein